VSVTIYRLASSAFTLLVLARVFLLMYRAIKSQIARYNRYQTQKQKSDPAFLKLQIQKSKKELDEWMSRDKAHRENVTALHYEYKGFINLSRIESDRKKLFEDKWSNWEFSKTSHELQPCPGDYQSQCIKMFGEMSFARKSIIAKDPSFWTADKELFWRNICHPAIKAVDVRESTFFETRQRILAENEFNHGDDRDRSSA
jgi:hypothetical protein